MNVGLFTVIPSSLSLERALDYAAGLGVEVVINLLIPVQRPCES
jgi:hypothetical protein